MSHIKKGFQISKLAILKDDTVCEITLDVEKVSGKKTYWKVYSIGGRFEPFSIVTNTENEFWVEFPTPKKKDEFYIPDYVLANAVYMILYELHLCNPEKIPTFHLDAYNRFLISEFKAAGFKIDRSKPHLTLVYKE